MAMARKPVIQHPSSGHEAGPLPHSTGAAKLASFASSASGEEITDLGFLSQQTSVLHDSQTVLKLQSSVPEMPEDANDRKNGLLHHHLKATSIHSGAFNSVVPRGGEENMLDSDSGCDNASSSSFEFPRGASRPIINVYLKSAPSKWDDAQKWLVNQSSAELPIKVKTKSGPLHAQGCLNSSKRVAILNPQDSQSHPHANTKNGYQPDTAMADREGSETVPLGDGSLNVKMMTASHCEHSFDFPGERMKKMDAVKGSAHNFAFVPLAPKAKSNDCHPVADELDDMKEVSIAPQENGDGSLGKPVLRIEKPTSDSFASAPYMTPEPAVRSVSMRDMGTEMTPITSQEPSRTGTPILATTPTMHSPVSSCPSTPRRAMPAPSPVGLGEDVSGSDCDTKAPELNEKEKQMKTRREIQVLGAQLGKVSIAAWASKEEEDTDASKLLKNIDLEEVKKNVLETRAAAWEEAEQAKYMARFRREEAKIQAWENHKRSKAEAEMRRIEVKVERTRSHAQERLMNKLSAARRKAEELRAAAEARRCEEATKAAERADYIRGTGRLPSSFFSCSWCS